MLTIRQLWPALRTVVVLTVILGLAYPFLVWGVGQVAFRDNANGSLIERDGEVVGSALIGQNFEAEQYFYSRPSAAGEDGYDGLASAGSNLGPTSEELLTSVQERKAAVAEENGVPESAVPADAVTASSSGLDPDISPAYADLQVERVARVRGLDVATVRRLVAEHTDGRSLGFMGEPHVNVLELNLALDDLG